jgi:hypothetical protein
MSENITSLKDIGYRTEVVEQYAKGLHSCKDWKEVKNYVDKWKFLAQDAVIFTKMCSKKYDWQMCLKLIKKNNLSKDEKHIVTDIGYIFMPAVIFHVGIMADQFRVPWGCMYIRLKEVGSVLEKKGISYLHNA